MVQQLREIIVGIGVEASLVGTDAIIVVITADMAEQKLSI